jgi:sulfite reductase (NADPH) flavoprotein alpha-component
VHVVDLASLKRGGMPEWSHLQACLLIVSTHGDGVPPPEARPAFDFLKKAAASGGAVGLTEPPPFSVLALGDTSYDKFCAAGKALETYLLQLGGQPLSKRCDVNKEDWSAIDAWFGETLAALLGRSDMTARLPAGSLAAATSARIEPEEQRGSSKAMPLLARLVSREALTNCGDADDKETIRLEFDVSSESGEVLSYTPGDALGVFPQNAAEEVVRLLSAFRLSEVAAAAVPLPAWRLTWPGPPGRDKSLAPLAQVLEGCFDLRDPKPQLLVWLADHCGPAAVANGTQELLRGGAAGSPAALRLQEYLGMRHVADIVFDAQLPLTAEPPASPESVLSMLRILQPRLYSISSSPLEADGRISITVAVVRYDTLNLPRVGVCSTFLASRLAVGCAAPVFVAPNPDFRLPESGRTPTVMVGPGTGLAPFRSFIRHRHLLDAGLQPPQLLFFGCRDADKDFLYRSELEAWHAAGIVQLFTAFSRPAPLSGTKRAYVQHRLAEQSALVFSMLTQGAHFYVCGDGGRMAKDVQAQLLSLLGQGFVQTEGLGEQEAAKRAEQYVETLETEGRLQRDVWFS